MGRAHPLAPSPNPTTRPRADVDKGRRARRARRSRAQTRRAAPLAEASTGARCDVTGEGACQWRYGRSSGVCRGAGGRSPSARLDTRRDCSESLRPVGVSALLRGGPRRPRGQHDARCRGRPSRVRGRRSGASTRPCQASPRCEAGNASRSAASCPRRKTRVDSTRCAQSLVYERSPPGYWGLALASSRRHRSPRRPCPRGACVCRRGLRGAGCCGDGRSLAPDAVRGSAGRAGASTDPCGTGRHPRPRGALSRRIGPKATCPRRAPCREKRRRQSPSTHRNPRRSPHASTASTTCPRSARWSTPSRAGQPRPFRARPCNVARRARRHRCARARALDALGDVG